MIVSMENIWEASYLSSKGYQQRELFTRGFVFSLPPRGESVQALDKVALDSFNKASQHPLSPSGEIKYIYIDRRNVRQILINERATDPSMVTAFLHVYTKGK